MAKAKTAKTEVVEKESPLAHVEITVPQGEGQRKNISVDALDSMTQAIAKNTFITVGGKMLSCRGFRINYAGNLVLTVEPVCFTIKEREEGMRGK